LLFRAEDFFGAVWPRDFFTSAVPTAAVSAAPATAATIPAVRERVTARSALSGERDEDEAFSFMGV
jgi:hypothetical protein